MIIKRLELTEIQKGIYFDCQIDNPADYNISASILLEGLEEQHFANAFSLLVGQQEALSSCLVIEDELPLLAIHDRVDFELRREDLNCSESEQDEQLQRVIEQEICKPFELLKAPLFRARLIKLPDNRHLFLLVVHHIISDGLSLEHLKNRLLFFYQKLVKRESFTYEVDRGFSDFIEKENAKLAEGSYSRQKEFWMEKMKNAEPLSLLPDFSVRQKRGATGREMRFELPAQLMDSLNELAMEQEATSFMLFLASFAVLLKRYTGGEDVIFSSPFSHRPLFEYEETAGCFIYTLPLRFMIADDEPFSAVIERASKELIDSYKNIGYPNNLIMRDSGLVPMPGSPSIFDISFVYDIYEEPEFNELKNEIVEQDSITFPGNMMVILNKTPDKDQIKIQYKAGVFSDETIRDMGERFVKLLETVAGDVDVRVKDIELMLPGERQRIMQDFNRSSFFPYRECSIIDIFHEKVAKHPGRVALVEGERKESYAEVDRRANLLAAKIMGYKKGANDSVGIQLERSIDLVIAILAVLKSGGAYVPIDNGYPEARKEFIFEDASISLLITSKNLSYSEQWPCDLIFVDEAGLYDGEAEAPLVELDPFSLSYIMYTSGSTGKPKGVMIENHSVVNTLLDLERRFPLEADDLFLLKTPFTFDVSVTELFGWFMGEGALYILEPGGEKRPELILEEIERRKISHVNFVPSMFRLFLDHFDSKESVERLNSLKWIFTGGEAITPDIIQKFDSLNSGIKLENVYGPTECTIWASHYSLKDYSDSVNVPIGRPLNEIRWYIVGKDDEALPVGIPGELCLSGAGLARGYLNRDELTAEKFVANPFYDAENDATYFNKIYRTGDLARWLPDGTIEFLGRLDFQVKIRGSRLELGEIENVLAEYEGVVQAVVVVKKSASNPAFLCAYYLSDDEIESVKLRDHLARSLPAYMIPSFFVHKSEMPLNSSGKVNRNLLIADRDYLKHVVTDYSAPETKMESVIADIWKEALALPRVGLDDNFFEIGGHSLAVIQVQNRLKRALNRELSSTLLFQAPTIRLLAESLSDSEEKGEIEDRSAYFSGERRLEERDIAIIGMAVRVPGANSVDDFWSNIKGEKESIHFYDDSELDNLGVAPELYRAPNFVRAKGRVDDIDYFDSTFFDYSPAEVRMMSPQLRLLYKGTWEALEDAGYYPGCDSSRVGLFLGGSDDFEWYKRFLTEDEQFSDKYQMFTLSTNHFLASRVAYKLDIKGPVFSALTGCSTTLVTPHLSCQSLILGECDLAVAGGITVELPNEGGYFYEDGMMFSPDGHCRPFDAKAKGTMFSNGMGIVVMKRLEEARRDGDNIYAVIKGSAINNDGNQKVGFVAPSVEGQSRVIREAYRIAGIDPESVGYIEAHGTGTSLGDPIEVESLTRAFSTEKKQYCMLGSVKGNVGHTDTAAGVVGLAKVALSLKHGFIPGTVNFEEINPKIALEESPFMVSARGREWKSEESSAGVLRAGINSFGVGGTNAHMVLEEGPELEESSPADCKNLLIFSAKSAEALATTSERVVDSLFEKEGLNLSDAAWTLQVGRKPFAYRKCLVVDGEGDSRDELLTKLRKAEVCHVEPGDKAVYFMFSGQGSQYQGMGRELYFSSGKSALSRVYKRYIDQVFDLLPEEERAELLEIIYGDSDRQLINRTEYSQFAIFATGYALARTLMELGVAPAGLIGHSIGEVTAAAVAGSFELKDAVEIVRLRGRIMQAQKPGSMLAVLAPVAEIEGRLKGELWLALDNSSSNCVVGGSKDAVSRFAKELSESGYQAIPVKTSHAFHTPMMEEAAAEFAAKLANYTINEPQIPLLSNVSGSWVEEGSITEPGYWAEHILKRVNFTASLSELLKAEDGIFVELGAGRSISTFAMQHVDKKAGQQFINLLRHPKERADDVDYLNERVGRLWAAGISLDWQALKGESRRRRLSLPTYVFDREHYPIDYVADEAFSLDSATSKVSDYAGLSVDLGELEERVLEAYNSVLGYDRIALDADFFSLGGDSLKAVSMVSLLKKSLGIDLDVTSLFSYTTPASLAAYLHEIGKSESAGDSAIVPAAEREFYPLSSAQNRMFALNLLDKESLAYNLPSATLIKGPLSKERLESALTKVTERHESLRTSFEVRDSEAVQIVHKTVPLPLSYSERAVSSDEDIDLLIKEFVKPFNLQEAPLFRAELVQTGVESFILLFDLHHIIADGTSVEIITRDFNSLYFGELEATEIQYRDFAIWQNSYLKSAEIERQREYWLSIFSDELPLLELPTDFERPAVKDFAGGRVYFNFDKDLTGRVMDFVQESGATAFMTLLSVWYLLLARYSGQDDIIIGSPTSGRNRYEIKETVGMFVNMLAMRNRPEAGKSFGEFLLEVKESALKAFENQSYQFDELVEQLNLKRELNRNALFDVCFDYQNMDFYELELEDVRFTPYQFETGTASYDLVMTCWENKNEGLLEGFLEYSTALFSRESVERMVGHFKQIVELVTTDKGLKIGEVDLLLPQERSTIIEQFNSTTLDVDFTLTIQEMFEQNAERFPAKTALVVASGQEFSYGELNERANRLAAYLRELGVTKESMVGVMPRRDENLFVAILGVLKAGAAYVPIDPAFPEERVSYMLEQCRVSTLICPAEYRDRVDFSGVVIDINGVDLDSKSGANPVESGAASDLACVIFTSGSTGRPKGVMINQGSLVNFVHDIKNRGIFASTEDRVISVTTLSFDIFGFESITPLCTGNSIYLANEEEQLDPALAAEKIVEHRVTHILSTVSRIKAFVENPAFEGALKQLSCILSGGENYPLPLLQDLQSRSKAKIYNMYGPTETTIWSTTKDLTEADSINIGRPVANTAVYIINPSGRLQPIGVYGELCIAGEGLARGYINNPDETAKRFITSPELEGARLYRTGDRARLLANGEIELMGRLDSQIKIRGYRIELDEIEKVVLGYENVREAVVLPFEDRRGNKQLALYYCLKERGEKERLLKEWLNTKLPHYMVPSYFNCLESMPVLPNGKINRKGFTLPGDGELNRKSETLLPASQLQEKIAEAWKEVLTVDSIGRADNFFDVGGNSLAMILVSNKLSSSLGRTIPLVQLFKYPTIEALARSLGDEKIESESAGQVELPEAVNEGGDIAVIGMSCKFPGAANIADFWQNLVGGVESIRTFSDEELEQSGVTAEMLANPRYIKAKGFLDGAEHFDNDFFDYPYQESNMMDPQSRMLHQCVWEVLEDGGYDPTLYDGRIGLFAGSGSNIAWMSRFLGGSYDQVSAYEAMTLNEKDFLTTRISYKLNLKGPSFNIQTACSTSLVAVHQACESLRRGESTMAIAGGISISFPRKEGYLWHEGMIFSKDGHCRPFDSEASGTISGNGCGLVLLKPLEAALRDGDHLYGVVKGSAINNDGLEKVGYTAPSVSGQAYVIEKALRDAGLPAEEIDYLEAHGTGTTLGDPIEVEALKAAWKTEKRGYCALGSVKANIGHLDSAAGIAGFIKSVLSLYHKTAPPQINFSSANSRINLEKSPFYINKEAKSYDRDGERPLRAGVSSFGIGGTNVHVLLEQPPAASPASWSDDLNLLVFSARSQAALENSSRAVVEHLQNSPDLNLSDVAWTLQKGRRAFEYRKSLVVNGKIPAKGSAEIERFMAEAGKKVSDSPAPSLFIFPAQGSYHSEMGRELYNSAGKNRVSSIYKSILDELLSLLPNGERDEVKGLLLGERESAPNAKSEHYQLIHFMSGYGLAKTVLKLGVKADRLIGSALGRVTAAAVAGIFEPADAMELAKLWGQSGGKLFRERAARCLQNHPSIPLNSDMEDPDYWVREAGAVDKAGDSIEKLLSEEQGKVIEIGTSLSSTIDSIALLPAPGDKRGEPGYFIEQLGQLWSAGYHINWSLLHSGAEGEVIRKKVPLPHYRFDCKYHDNDVRLDHLELKERTQSPLEADKVDLTDKESTLSRLIELWKVVLGSDEINPDDDFFDLGGHSLKAVSLAAQVERLFKVEIPIGEIFDNSTPRTMAEWLGESGQKQSVNMIEPIAPSTHYEVSSAQKRMYAVHQFVGDSVPYNLASVYRIEGVVDKARFKQAFRRMVERHDAFRTTFTMRDGEVVQTVVDEVGEVVEFCDISAQGIERAIGDFVRPFDLSRAPLLRVRLATIAAESHLLMIDMHHIISDQSSIAILLDEFEALYRGEELPALNIHYKDFAAWQNRLFESEEFKGQLDYWRGELAGELPQLQLLTDYVRPQVQTFAGDRLSFALGSELDERINRVAAESGLTPYMLFMAALKLVLWKSSGQEDLIVGTAVAGRRHAAVDSIVGMFVNTLAIRSQIDAEMTVSDYLGYIKGKMLKAYENQDCQFEMLIESLAIEKDMGRNPLFDVVINYINMGTDELSIEGLKLTPWEDGEVEAKFDITWTIEEREGHYYTDIEYAKALFKAETIEAISKRLIIMLNQITSDLERSLSDLYITTDEERRWLLHELNDSATAFPAEKTLVQLFEEQVQQAGDRVAIIKGAEKLTYSQLNMRANRVAELLLKEGVAAGDCVAIMLERSPLQIVAILGILKVGAAYLPIDPDYPSKRINFMLEDSGTVLLLSCSQFLGAIEGSIDSILFDNEPEMFKKLSSSPVIPEERVKSCSAGDTAYIMYTSGSTGTPKGALISHRNVSRVVINTNYIEINRDDRLLQLSNYAFDGSVFDIYGALLNGASLVMLSKEEAIEVPRLLEIIKTRKVTIFFVTTALFNMLVDWDVKALHGVRKILSGGELVSTAHMRKAFEALGPGRVIHVYGPTESTVFATYYPVDAVEEGDSSIPIGYPLANTTAYVLDKQGQLVPPNVPGELYIGGDGLAKGYLNREELTAEKFLNHPFKKDGKVYCTGDRVWRLPGGEIQFGGRFDFQIKIRGFRVELGEIETHIVTVPGIKEAIVVANRDSHNSLYIAAYYTVDGATGGLMPEELKELLTDSMPEYMVPSRMMRLEVMPLNLNGKIDRKALPHIEESSTGGSGYEGPDNELEEVLLKAMQNCLDRSDIGVNDDFFSCGGQSIKAIALMQQLLKEGIELKVNDIFQSPTVRELARLPQLQSVVGDVERSSAALDVAGASELITLKSSQIDSLAQFIGSSGELLSRLLVSSELLSQFPLSPVQLEHLKFGSSTSGFTATIDGRVDEKRVREIFANIIMTNQLLHSVLEEGDEPCWKEYDIAPIGALLANSLAYSDLTIYEAETRELIVEKLYSRLLLSPYMRGQLPWRLGIVRLTEESHLVIWGFDHTAFDGMSADVIRGQIERAVKEPGRPVKEAESYSDYVALLANGPCKIEASRIEELFSLGQWQTSSELIMDKLAQNSKGKREELDIEIPLQKGELRDPWQLSIDFTTQLLRGYTGMDELPLGLVNYGRGYGDSNFYNCVGEFLDIIPVVIGKVAAKHSLSDLLQECRQSSINFISLAAGRISNGAYSSLSTLLKPFYCTGSEPKRMVLFNFQGFVSEAEKEAFKDEHEVDEETSLAQLVITVNYDEHSLYINIESPEGIDSEAISSISQALSFVEK